MHQQDHIIIKGARTNNLKNISIDIPKKKIVVFTGVSGSGKSSLVFDTIYTESQRQLVETFSSFARARLPKLTRPDIDEISNISTSIVIDQQKLGHNPRSTVGTATEIYTYLKLLYSRCGQPFIGPSFLFGFNHPQGMCLKCSGIGTSMDVDVERLIDRDKSIKDGAIRHPDYRVDGWNWREYLGIGLFDVEKKIRDFTKDELDRFLHADGIPVQKKHGGGVYTKNYEGIVKKLKRLYLINNPEDLCEARKNAYNEYFVTSICKDCNGTRLNSAARAVLVDGRPISALVELELVELRDFIRAVNHDLAKTITPRILQSLDHLIDIGVGYLSLNRPTGTLSGGEAQRLKMARQLNCNLVDMVYIMDEPSIGLHAKDVNNVIDMIKQLRDKGNTVLVVEHDPSIIRSADHVIEVGPGAGANGGEICFSGNTEALLESDTITARHLRKQIAYRYGKRKEWTKYIQINGANINNLKNISTRVPLEAFTCITGVAGSGKSSLVHGALLKMTPNAVVVDQGRIGQSNRSNPATYVGVFDSIRKIFAEHSKLDSSFFSFNSKGACPKCRGQGVIRLEMHFLDDVEVLCDECEGKRYIDEVLGCRIMGKNILDVLDMTIEQANMFFCDHDNIKKKLSVLVDVGLGYLKIGQRLSSLSGGEAQRIKLASELHKSSNIYILDEPSTGLHMADVERLVDIIRKIVKNGNTVITIEHNMDIIKHADWIIDLGPEGGRKGGEILFEGTPENLICCSKSHTGKHLQAVLTCI
ncbi:MAG: daunorubicin resistance protein DrrC [Bdellovibrionales bacterium RIFOXYD1_FULL_53_11]|nr:MAG: daunorubicin resistance protein DrrC [Bdellovibrionales bacterium RIFOXYD1_FULL_53_11]